MSGIAKAHNAAALKDRRFYHELEVAFTEIKNLRDQYDILTARQWGASDEKETRDVTLSLHPNAVPIYPAELEAKLPTP